MCQHDSREHEGLEISSGVHPHIWILKPRDFRFLKDWVYLEKEDQEWSYDSNIFIDSAVEEKAAEESKKEAPVR